MGHWKTFALPPEDLLINEWISIEDINASGVRSKAKLAFKRTVEGLITAGSGRSIRSPKISTVTRRVRFVAVARRSHKLMKQQNAAA